MFGRLQEAGYAARTDHLRRMMEKSRTSRQTKKRWTYLDLASFAGRWTWLAGLCFELLWHFSSISTALEEVAVPEGQADWIPVAKSSLHQLAARLPSKDVLISLSLWSNILTVWWNPLFVQVFRGFSRHVLGLAQWYTFQALMIFIRAVFSQVPVLAVGQGTDKSAEITAHIFMACLMTLVGFSPASRLSVS